MLMKLATKALPVLLGGVATGVLSCAVEKAVSGNGLGCREMNFQFNTTSTNLNTDHRRFK